MQFPCSFLFFGFRWLSQPDHTKTMRQRPSGPQSRLSRDASWMLWQPPVSIPVPQHRQAPTMKAAGSRTMHRVSPLLAHQFQCSGARLVNIGPAPPKRDATHAALTRARSESFLWYRSSWHTHATPSVESLVLHGDDDHGNVYLQNRPHRPNRSFSSAELKAYASIPGRCGRQPPEWAIEQEHRQGPVHHWATEQLPWQPGALAASLLDPTPSAPPAAGTAARPGQQPTTCPSHSQSGVRHKHRHRAAPVLNNSCQTAEQARSARSTFTTGLTRGPKSRREPLQAVPGGVWEAWA